jgi:hypothetical protein
MNLQMLAPTRLQQIACELREAQAAVWQVETATGAKFRSIPLAEIALEFTV